jgi:NitT/TauT family transport system substrate-binding protein
MRSFVMAAVLGLSLLSSACQAAPAAPPTAAPTPGVRAKLVVGYLALNATQVPSWVAKELGIFDRNGLDVDLQYLPTSTSPIAAVLAGEVQVIVAAEQPIQADLNGADLVYIAAPTSTIFYALYARPEITDAAGLKGKKLGITGVGAATETAGKMALRSLNLDPSTDVTMTNLGSAPNILAALQNGAVDAGMLSSPTNLQAQALGMRELVNTAKLGNPFPSSWPTASRKYIAENRDTIARYVKSIAEAIAFEIGHPAETQRVLAQYVKLDDPAIARAAYDEVVPHLKKNPKPDPQAVRAALDELGATMPQARSADPATFIDARFTDELESSGFIKSLYP